MGHRSMSRSFQRTGNRIKLYLWTDFYNSTSLMFHSTSLMFLSVLAKRTIEKISGKGRRPRSTSFQMTGYHMKYVLMFLSTFLEHFTFNQGSFNARTGGGGGQNLPPHLFFQDILKTRGQYRRFFGTLAKKSITHLVFNF